MTNKAYILYQLKKMYRELGNCVPTQDEFTRVISRYWIKKEFGTYNNLLIEAGFEPNKEGVGRKKKECS